MVVGRLKRFLYYAPDPGRFAGFLAELAAVPEGRTVPGAVPPHFAYDGVEVCWVSEHAPDDAMACLRTVYVNLVLLDLRARTRAEQDLAVTGGCAFLDVLDGTDDVETRYGFHRIVALVDGPDPEAVDALMVELGARGVRTVLRPHNDERTDAGRVAFTARVMARAVELVGHRPRGRRALCAAGGGITGIYFELGALKCLDDCLGPDAVNSFDMYFGISAGAVVTSLIASGYSADEFMASIAGVEGGRMPPLDLRLLRWAHLNHRDLEHRLGHVLAGTVQDLWDMARRRHSASLTSLLFGLSEAMAPPFHSDSFEAMLRRILDRPGASNDFRRLPVPLYIGATDQDARQHVLFGAEGTRDVPISRAVQASLSINPAFSAVSIGGRYYEDGAVTRTSNFGEAIRRHATLVCVLDPFVPYVSRTPGRSRDRGMLYNIDQNIRTITFTRFENAQRWVLRQHPEVSSYTFLPSNRLRRRLSSNPMDHRPYREIWRGAYLSTFHRIQRLCHRMRGDFVVHGVYVDLARAAAVAERLRHTPHPDFADFFPDRRVELRQPPMATAPGPTPTAPAR